MSTVSEYNVFVFMLYSLSGKLILKGNGFVILETAAGIGFKVLASPKALKSLPNLGGRIKLFCFFALNRDGFNLYGFSNEREMERFESLNSVSGIGPRAAFRIVGDLDDKKFSAAVSAGRPDVLEKSAGIGRKKAQRIVLELKDKIKKQKNVDLPNEKEEKENVQIAGALKKFGYKKNEIATAMNNLPADIKSQKERLRAALKLLSGK